MAEAKVKTMAMTVAAVGGKRSRVERGVVEVAVVVQPDSAHAVPGGVHPAELRGRLGNDFPYPCRPRADVTNEPSEVVDGVVELPVEVDALAGRCLDPLLKPREATDAARQGDDHAAKLPD